MRRRMPLALCLIVLALGIAACGDSSGDQDTERQTTVEKSEAGRMLGPTGEEAVPADEITLSDEDVEKVKAGNYTAALVWHDGSADFAVGLTNGIEDRFKELGVEVVAVTDAQFDAAKQQRDLNTALARSPDAVLTIPVDALTADKLYKPALEKDVKLVFLSNVPKGYVHGKDYVGVVSSDQIATGENAAKIMGDALGGKGKIGYIFYDADFFITNQRDASFKQSLKENYPDIEIAASAGFEDPARVEEIASAMLARNPDLDGIYTTWAQPAEGVLSALRQAGRDDVKVVTVDLSQPIAIDMAKGGPTAGVSADAIYEMGQKMAEDAALGLIGKEAPAFATVDSIPVTGANLLEGWQESFGQPAPAQVQKAAE